jgi:predicted RNase H-like HicB family nuclease
MYKFINFIYNSIKGVKRMKKTYTIIIHKEEDGYWAECQEIKGCFAQAKTVDELKELMKQSIYLYFSEDEKDCEKVKDIEVELSYA